MTETIPHHDSGHFLEVHWAKGTPRLCIAEGWYVRRTCACHKGVIVSKRFGSEKEAYRCLWALDADCRQTLARNAETQSE